MTFERKNSILKFVIFLYALGFMHLEKYMVFVIAFLLIILSDADNRFRIVMQYKDSLKPLILWSFSYSLMYVFSGEDILTGLVYYLFAPVLMHLVGRHVSRTSEKPFDWLFIIALGFFIHGALNIIQSSIGGYFIHNSEFVYDIWSGNLNNRTIIGLYLTPIVCVAIPIVFLGQNYVSLIRKIFFALVAIASIVLSVYIGNRTLLVIAAFLCAYGLMIKFRESQHKLPFIVLTFVIVVLLVWGYFTNLDYVQNLLEKSFLSRRTELGLESGRWGAYKEIFDNWFSYLGGWITRNWFSPDLSLSWAHNIWLDIFIVGGIIPLVLFLSYTIRIVKEMLYLQKSDNNLLVRRVGVILMIGIFLNWAVEPVLEANPYYFSLCCMIFSILGSMPDRLIV